MFSEAGLGANSNHHVTGDFSGRSRCVGEVIGDPVLVGKSPSSYCWTDDLPVCDKSALAGRSGAERQTLRVELDPDFCLYGTFDGLTIDSAQVKRNEEAEPPVAAPTCKVYAVCPGVVICQCSGCCTARLAQQLMPAELCFGQIGCSATSMKTVEGAMEQAWAAVDDALEVSAACEGVCCAAVAVLLGRRLVVGNTGDVCVLLTTVSPSVGSSSVVTLSSCHRVDCNPAELQRLSALGVDVTAALGSRPCLPSCCWKHRRVTRCLGSNKLNSVFRREAGDYQSSTVCQPIIASPEFRSLSLPPQNSVLLMATNAVLDRVGEIIHSSEADMSGRVEGCHGGISLAQWHLARLVLNQLDHHHNLQLTAQGVLQQLWNDSEPPKNAILLIRAFAGQQSGTGERISSHSARFESSVASSASTGTLDGVTSSEDSLSPTGGDADITVSSYVDFSEFYKSSAFQNDEDWWKTILNE